MAVVMPTHSDQAKLFAGLIDVLLS